MLPLSLTGINMKKQTLITLIVLAILAYLLYNAASIMQYFRGEEAPVVNTTVEETAPEAEEEPAVEDEAPEADAENGPQASKLHPTTMVAKKEVAPRVLGESASRAPKKALEPAPVIALGRTPVVMPEVEEEVVEEKKVWRPQCSDGIDNDRDGVIDFAGDDDDCLNTADNSEGPECNDGIDNDNDGVVDFAGDDDGCVNEHDPFEG